ncbi:Per1-like-domain-containing protein [Cokeromyces recurvatus]|uniref:Per1-like-domain-containing protein n=1 Tax=Cokeromyces recurvatus TaxID=90255 RepID=UPI002220A129|nr:Per1-like-domain-containing protein [Cokeromyces recurvatus]KAI7905739.1 Per1-like-domain-containing protein [Cokeromyces recurvatus]
MPTKKPIKVAVIGSGLAGLTATYLLNNSDDVEVHLFEKNDSLGMDAASISVGPKNDFRIDVPMRSFMSGYYTHLFKLYKYLKIPIKKAKFSFGWYRIMMQPSCTIKKSLTASQVASYTKNESYLIYSGARTVGHLSRVKKSIMSSKDIFIFLWQSMIVALSYLWLLFISLWHHYQGHLRDPHHAITNMTLDQFFKRYHIHPYFAYDVFVPLFAAVCTNTYESMLNYPASDVLEYMAVGFFQESYVVACGVQQVVTNISKSFKHVHLNTQIAAIRSVTNDQQGRFKLIDEYDQTYFIDHIIFATQGNQAHQILKSYLDDTLDNNTMTTANKVVKEQIETLKTFPYDKAMVINHTDTRLLPSNPLNWKALNLATVDQSVNPGESDLIIPYPHNTTMATHILHMTHKTMMDNNSTCYLQTTNPCIAVDPDKLLSVAWFERATVTLESKRALRRLFTDHGDQVQLGSCQGFQNGIWFIGSYCWKGIPLLEGCVASAEYVVTKGIARTMRKTAMVKPSLLLVALVTIITTCYASSGDRQIEYINCVERCTANTDISQLPFYLQLLRWTVRQDCGYHCMQTITQYAMANNQVIHQYYGKWPFHRVFGIQEPASVVFSILNGLMHFHYFKQIKRHIPQSYRLRHFYLGIAIIGMNAWLWSTIFHMRDTPFTEKLDYFSAGLYILYSFCVATIRIFYLKGASVLIWSIFCLLLYIAHVSYLSSLQRFDYSYNMLACIIVGSCQTQLWLIWSIMQYTEKWGRVERRPFAWMAGLSVILVSCAMCLEIFDFPPFYQIFDAHSLWHAATIPLVPLFYRFLLRDTECEMTLSRLTNEKRSL